MPVHIFLFLLSIALTGHAWAIDPGDYTRTVQHDGRDRSYILHAPKQVAEGKPLPMVIMLHGGTGTARGAARWYGWNELADEEGFLVAYPDGTGRLQTWNAMHCCGSSLREDVDDVGFIRAMIDDIAAATRVDRSRIFATGMSNGGMMSFRLGGEMSDVLAAIGPVCGSNGGRTHATGELRLPSQPRHPVAVMAVFGQADDNVPFDGGHPRKGLVKTRVDVSAAESIAFWVKANQCAAEPKRRVEKDGKVTIQTYVDRKHGADVVLVAVRDLGHAWPG